MTGKTVDALLYFLHYMVWFGTCESFIRFPSKIAGHAEHWQQKDGEPEDARSPKMRDNALIFGRN